MLIHSKDSVATFFLKSNLFSYLNLVCEISSMLCTCRSFPALYVQLLMLPLNANSKIFQTVLVCNNGGWTMHRIVLKLLSEIYVNAMFLMVSCLTAQYNRPVFYCH